MMENISQMTGRCRTSSDLALLNKTYEEVKESLCAVYPRRPSFTLQEFYELKCTSMAEIETYYKNKVRIGLAINLPKSAIVQALSNGVLPLKLPNNDHRARAEHLPPPWTRPHHILAVTVADNTDTHSVSSEGPTSGPFGPLHLRSTTSSNPKDRLALQVSTRPQQRRAREKPSNANFGSRTPPKLNEPTCTLTQHTPVSQLLKHDIITSSSNPYSSPVTLVRKRDDTMRLCIDLRRVNELVPSDLHPLPLIETVLDNLSKARVFSTVDISNAYYQIPIVEESQPLLSFLIHKHHLSFIAHYYDDFVIFSDSSEQHLTHLRLFFKFCLKENLQLNLKKCNFYQNEIDFLGYHITAGTYTPNIKNTEIINAIRTPINIKTLQSFLGAVNVYHKFIPEYARLRHPSNQLLKKNAKWLWSPNCQQAFDKLKQHLATQPVLHLFQEGLPCQVYCDASTQGIAGVLKQVHPDGNIYPVQYYSRALRSYERNYTISELECLAIVECVDKFRVYLLGTRFVIYSDHHALQWLKTIKDPTGRLFRWSLRLSAYDYEVKYLKGSRQYEADLLSRNPFCGFLSTGQIKDHQGELRRDIRYILNDKDLMTITRRGVTKIIVPPSLRGTLLQRAHRDFNHPGISQMTRLIAAQYYWDGMTNDIRTHVRTCSVCQLVKPPKGPIYGELGQLPPAVLPYELVSLDTISGFAKYGNSQTFLHVVVDHATRYAWAFPSRSTSILTYTQVIKKVMQFGSPKRLLTDRAPAFTSPKFRRFLIRHNIGQLLTTSNNPQANGLSERLNATITGKLKLLRLQQPKTAWTKLLPQVLQSYNHTPHSVTWFPPSYLLLGSFPIQLSEHVQNYTKIDDARELAYQRTHERNLRDKARFDQTHRASDFEVGDLVLAKTYHHPDTGKLAPFFSGPYEILEIISPQIVRINRSNRPLSRETDTIHANKLKHYTENEQFISPPDRDLMLDLARLKLNPNENVNMYIVRAQKLAQEITQLGKTVTERELVRYIVEGLTPNFDTIAAALSINREISLPDLRQTLLDFEKKRQDRNKNHENAFRSSGNQFKEKSCFICKRKGHFKKDCWFNPNNKGNQNNTTNKNNMASTRNYHKGPKQNKDTARSAIQERTEEPSQRRNSTSEYALHVITREERPTTQDVWIIDSACTSHMTSHGEWIEHKTEERRSIQVAEEGRHIESASSGSIQATVQGKDKLNNVVTLHNVLHVPHLKGNLMSIPSVVRRGNSVLLNSEGAYIYSSDDKLIGTGNFDGNMYTLNLSRLSEATHVPNEHCLISKDNSRTAWHRRLGHPSDNKLDLILKNNLLKGLDSINGTLDQSDACSLGKMTKVPYVHTDSNQESYSFEAIYVDLCGPMRINSLGGKFLKDKLSAAEVLKKFIVKRENELNSKLKRLRTDNGTEFINKNLETFIESKGIKHELTTPYTPRSNERVERANRTLLDKGRTLLADSQLPLHFWAEAVNTAAYLYNLTPTTNDPDTTPMEKWKGKKPSVSHIMRFGCEVFYKLENHQRHKLEAKSKRGIFVGYSRCRRTYRVFDITTRVILETADIHFRENNNEDEQLDNHVLSDVDIEEPAPDIMINRQTESSGSDRPQRTRTIPKTYKNTKTYYVLATTNETIPKDYEEAIACEDKKHWENAMLERGNTEHVLTSSMGTGRDYNESFSPVIKNATLRTILSMAATKDSGIKLFDVKAAYLNGNIENTIFMEQPAGFVQDRNKVCKLNKNSEDTSNRFINKLRHHLEIKDVTCKGMFLGIKIIQDKEGISLQQSHYVQQILQKYGMENCKEVPTPGSKEINLDNHIEDDNCDQHTYQEVLGMLMFLAVNTRPDIAYITSKLSQYSRQPKQMHWTAIKRTGILKSYTDASWSTTHDGKSYGGYVLKLCEATIDWKSSKQPLVALSTMEAEMIAACESCCQIKWIINLLRELEEWNFMEKPTAIYTDSQSLINWISSPKQSSRCRHINRKYHFLRDCYESRDICLLYKPSQDLEADIFTKDLSRDQMKKHLENLSISRQDKEMELNQDPIGVKSDGPTETMERRQEVRESEPTGERQEVTGRETTAPLADAVNQLSTLLTRVKISDGAESAIPPFDGAYSATQFFQTFDRKMEDASMGEQEKLLRLPNYLVRQPLELFRKLRLADRSYFQVRQILLDLYPESSEASFAKYFAMKLTGQANLETYYREKNRHGIATRTSTRGDPRDADRRTAIQRPAPSPRSTSREPRRMVPTGTADPRAQCTDNATQRRSTTHNVGSVPQHTPTPRCMECTSSTIQLQVLRRETLAQRMPTSTSPDDPRKSADGANSPKTTNHDSTTTKSSQGHPSRAALSRLR
ncbi:hypothetical protein LAZ67_3003881 [Cordylochernes scorpioides]|uniref:RNA-directed DNA polymerase n=1 Tax=Cordylochernes scorpioides TaxID=51811 RepID=A0ABY6K9X9_9ARAC|nr:hypothetical protein LAZ67_3003881 [Cordylochernes scorpioides]